MTDHRIAVVVGLVPTLAAWGLGLVTNTLNAAQANLLAAAEAAAAGGGGGGK